MPHNVKSFCADLQNGRRTEFLHDNRMAERDNHLYEPDRIRNFRKARGWSMRELALRTNSSASTINSLEKGKTQLTWNWIIRLAKAFEVSPEEIIGASPRDLKDQELGFKDWESGEDLEPINEDDAEYRSVNNVENQKLYRVRSDVLSDLGIYRNSIVAVDVGMRSANNLVTGDIIVGELRDGANKYMLMRQFIEPNLLITNSANNRPSIHLRADFFRILGVVVSSTSHFFGRSKPSEVA